MVDGTGFTLRTVWDWYRLRENITSPWAGVFLSASDPCNSPEDPLAKKVELSTCNVTLITQRDERKGGYWSRLLSLAVCLSHLSFSDSPPLVFFFFLSLSKSDLPNRKQARKGHSSRFQLPTRPDTSVRTCQGWLKWGRLPWQQFCHLPPAHVLRGRRRRRRRLSHHHHSLFSLCSPREIVPLEHTNGSVEVISLNLPDTSNKQETLSHEVWILFFNELLCRSWHC